MTISTGASWFNAYTSLAKACTTTATGATFWVAKGTYKPTDEIVGGDATYTIQIQDNDKLYGGFKGDEGSLDLRAESWKTYKTIISGDIGTIGSPTDNSQVVLNMNNNSLVDGVTIRDGLKGVYMQYDKGFLNNSIICNNSNYGIHMAPTCTNGVVSQCFIIDHTIASSSGKPLLIDGDPCLVQNCVFNNNHLLHTTLGSGAAARVAALKNAYFIYCSFVNNVTETPTGSSAIVGSVNTNITACVFYGNRAGGAGGDEVQILYANKLSYSAVEDVNGDGKALNNVTTYNVGNTISSTITHGFIDITNPAGSDVKYFTSDDGLNLTSSSTTLIHKGADSVYPFPEPTKDILANSRPINNQCTGAYEY